ncbi:MAG: peptide deformylase [Campylobacterales bacterium]|nr:peptide deformylase [Campylobacterales bacterium]
MGKILQIAQLGHPILQERAEEVTDIFDPSIQSLIDDMLTTTADSNGVGLAAPQVYELKRIIIVSSHPNARYPYAPKMEPTAMINPVITWESDEQNKEWEGCLSIPGIRGMVPRSTKIRIKYLDRDSHEIETEYADFIARVVQHECDHLNGISFLERVENPKELASEKEFLKSIAKR